MNLSPQALREGMQELAAGRGTQNEYLASREQVVKLLATLRRHGIVDRDARLALAAFLMNRPLESYSDLTQAWASVLIDWLEGCTEEDVGLLLEGIGMTPVDRERTPVYSCT